MILQLNDKNDNTHNGRGKSNLTFINIFNKYVTLYQRMMPSSGRLEERGGRWKSGELGGWNNGRQGGWGDGMGKIRNIVFRKK
jgi:hypothetical protein